jgi:hypothetical protein
MNRQIEPGQIWRHCEGQDYEIMIVGTAWFSVASQGEIDCLGHVKGSHNFRGDQFEPFAIALSSVEEGETMVLYRRPGTEVGRYLRSREDFLSEVAPGVPRFELIQSEDDRNFDLTQSTDDRDFDLTRFWAASPSLVTFAMAAHVLREYIKERFASWPEENQYLEFLAALQIVGMDVPNIPEKLLRGVWEIDDDSD